MCSPADRCDGRVGRARRRRVALCELGLVERGCLVERGGGRRLARRPVGDEVSAVLLGIIRFYQRWISPLTPPMCRFTPTCSNYAIDAIRLWGPVRGTGMGAARILRCHPFHPGGYDPVPVPMRVTGVVHRVDPMTGPPPDEAC